jgi:hypothetical protein
VLKPINVTFEEYLISKKINSEAFKGTEPLLWQEWHQLFEHLSPASFTAQKLYLINPIRRKYQLRESMPPASASAEQKPAARPMMRPKPKPEE